MMCLWANYEKKMWKNIFLASSNQWRKESNPELDPDPLYPDLEPDPDPLIRGIVPQIQNRTYQNVTDPENWVKGYFNWLSLNWEGGICSLFPDKTPANSNNIFSLKLSSLPFCRVGQWPPAYPRRAFLTGECCCAKGEAKPISLTSPSAAHCSQWRDNDLQSLQSAEPFPGSEEEPVALKSLQVPL